MSFLFTRLIRCCITLLEERVEVRDLGTGRRAKIIQLTVNGDGLLQFSHKNKFRTLLSKHGIEKGRGPCRKKKKGCCISD